jgi:hypothetical protein
MPPEDNKGEAIDGGAEAAALAQTKGPGSAQSPPASDDLAEKLAALEAQRALELQELETLRSEKKKADDAKLSETERLTRERDEARTAARRALVQVKSAQLGIVDPEVAAGLIPAETPDDKIEEALKALIDKKPYLKAAPNVGLTTPSGNPGRKPGLTIDQVRNMTTAEINKNWDAVQAALSGK